MAFTNLRRIILLACVVGFATCTVVNKKDKLNNAEIIHQNENQLTKLITYDVFNPPVSSRIYAYTSLAAYEALRFEDSLKYPSLASQLNLFGAMPSPIVGKQYNYTLAASVAFFKVARKVTFSVDSLVSHENKIFGQFKQELTEEEYERSVNFGDSIADRIIARSANDNYLRTRGKPKYIGSKSAGKWRPTAPDYFDGVEYSWGEITPFVLDSSSQFKPEAPIPYSEDTSSAFFKANKEVYDISNALTDEQRDIATFWDDNPFVMEHSGHMAFANKKLSPGGHWIGIAEIACKKTNANAVESARAYTLTAIAIYDAFISCWEAKYRTNVVRPITYINEHIDPNWMPFLQTPPFPEYSSGHSTITGAASVILTELFGDNFEFLDTSDLEYIGMQRTFKSFIQAAEETSISRLYGGIHVRQSIYSVQQRKY